MNALSKPVSQSPVQSVTQSIFGETGIDYFQALLQGQESGFACNVDDGKGIIVHTTTGATQKGAIADLATIVNSSIRFAAADFGWSNAGGTILVEAQPGSDLATRYLVEGRNADYSNLCFIRSGTAGNAQISAFLRQSGATVASLTTPVNSASNRFRMAMALEANNFRLQIGNDVLTDTVGAMVESLDNVTFGGTSTGGNQWGGDLHYFAYFPDRLSNQKIDDWCNG